MKKFTSIVMALLLLLSVCTGAVSAGEIETETKGDFIYQKGKNIILGYTGSSDTVEIPENTKIASSKFFIKNAPSVTKVILNDWKVTGTFNDFFPNVKEVEFKEGITELPLLTLHENETVEKVILPSTLKNIGGFAFKDCTALKTVELPDGLKSIERECFAGCTSLSGDITIPDTVTNMGYGVFSGCGAFDKVHISENASYTKDKEFSGQQMANWFGTYHLEYERLQTKVKEINIPKPVIRDKNCAFDAEEITFDGEMTRNIYELVKYSSWYNDKYIKGKTNKSTGGYKDFIIMDNTLLKYTGTDRNPVIPEGVETIVRHAFHAVDMDTVTLPSTLETIENEAFYFTTLKEITIPAGVKKIEDAAFAHCPLIEKAVFKGMPEEIGIGIFDESVWLGYDYQDNVIFEDKTKPVPEDRIYCNFTMYNLKDFCDYMNRVGGYKLKFDDDYITSPSYYEMFDILVEEKPETDVAPRPRQTQPNPFATPAPSSVPSEIESPSETVNPEATAEPQPADNPSETPVPKTLEVDGSNLAIKINDNTVDFPDAKPFIDDNDRTQIPVRAVAEMFGCDVDWNNGTVKMSQSGGNTVVLVIGSDIMTVNDEPVKMDTAAIIKDDRTYLPVRFIAEAMGLTVEWKN